MSYIFIDKESEQGGGQQSQMRSNMRNMMRSQRYGNRNYVGYRSYEDGYRDGYRHGYEDSEDDDNEEGYRRERDSRGRYI